MDKRIIFAVILAVTALLYGSPAHGARAISRMEADSLARRQVLYRGQVATFSTVGREVCRKLTGSDHVGRIDNVQFVASLALYPDEWLTVPFLKVEGDELRHRLGISGDYVAPASLYDAQGNYKLSQWYDSGKRIRSQIETLDERVEVLGSLVEGRLFAPLQPNDPDYMSPRRVALSVAYDRLQPWKWWFMLAVSVGMAAVVVLLIWGDGGKPLEDPASGKRAGKSGKVLRVVFASLAAVVTLAGIAAFVCNWIVIGRPPFIGQAPILLFMAVVAAAVAFILMCRRSTAVMGGIALVLAGAMGLGGWIGVRDAMTSPVMPGLMSDWLPYHVSLVMASYAVFALTLPAAAVLAFGSSSSRCGNDAPCGCRCLRRRMVDYCYSLLPWGSLLLALGIITGSIWAKTAWGRYWAWDPKENWALVTWIVYTAAFIPQLRLRSNPRRLGIYLLFAFLAVLITYFGVNYMNSVHAYNN